MEKVIPKSRRIIKKKIKESLAIIETIEEMLGIKQNDLIKSYHQLQIEVIQKHNQIRGKRRLLLKEKRLHLVFLKRRYGAIKS